MPKTPFDHINAITNNQRIDYYDQLEEVDKKSFNIYLITMGLSMTPDFIPLANEVNKYWDQLDARSTYLFYSQIIPKGKYYSKWVKGVKEDKYEDWLVQKISQHYGVSKSEAMEYIDIYYRTDEGRAELTELLKGYGVDPKKLRKIKL